MKIYEKSINGKKIKIVEFKFPYSSGYVIKKTANFLSIIADILISILCLDIPAIVGYYYLFKYRPDYVILVAYKSEKTKKIIFEHEMMHFFIYEKLKNRKDLMNLFHNQLDRIERSLIIHGEKE